MRYWSALTILTLIFCAPDGWTAPAAPITMTLTQPDGSTFEATSRGDEYASWMESADGISVVAEGGEWFYAVLDAGGDLVSSGTSVGTLSRSALSQWPRGVVPVVDPSLREKNYPRKYRDPSDSTRALTHSQNVLTILADYSDIAFNYSDASFQNLLYGASGSVKDFYLENSYGSYTMVPAAETYGTSNDGIVHVVMGKVHPNLGQGGWKSNAKSIITEADSLVNFASFDSNGDGALSEAELSIVIILAGYENSYGSGNAETPNVWGHKACFCGSLPSHDGVTIGAYTMFGERHGFVASAYHQATIGIMAHELGHLMLGLPDLYDTDGSSAGISEWGLMGAGGWNYTSGFLGESPAHLSAWAKVRIGMVDAEDVLTPTTGVSLLEGANNASIKSIWIDQYRSPIGQRFLLENRQLTGYDAGLWGSGLLIWHVDESKTSNSNDANRLADVEEADGLAQLDSPNGVTDAGDPFPGSSNNTTFDNASNPNSKDYSNANTGIAVTSISASSSSMTVDVTPKNVPYGESILYNEGLYTGHNGGYGSAEVWTAVEMDNDSLRDTLDGFEVYIRGASATVDFHLYTSMVGTTPTSETYTETGFAATSGWNRFMLATPQSFPAGSTRVLVLKIIDSTSTSPLALDISGAVSERSYIDSNGAGSFFKLTAAAGWPFDVSQHFLMSGGEVLDADSVWVDFGYGGTEVGTEIAPFNSLAEAVAVVNAAGAISIKPGSSSETITINQSVTLQASGGKVSIGGP